MKEWIKPLLFFLTVAATFSVGDFIRNNYYFCKRNYIKASESKSRIKTLTHKNIHDLLILKKALDDGGIRGLELVDLKSGEQSLFLEGFLIKVRNEYSGRYHARVTIYLLTQEWRDWFRDNDGFLDRFIDQVRKNGEDN